MLSVNQNLNLNLIGNSAKEQQLAIQICQLSSNSMIRRGIKSSNTVIFLGTLRLLSMINLMSHSRHSKSKRPRRIGRLQILIVLHSKLNSLLASVMKMFFTE